VREALYSSSPTTCPLIDSIVALSRPQRDGKPLDSIVTFNCDCLVEDNLAASSIANKAICSEAITHDANEMPVYHVHGYLPRTGPIDEQSDLVFSEDAYHSQFIDPFSWSNLIQLNKLTQNTCLFIGISLTDPNMRRLLDVAWRKNSDKRLGHYIAKLRPRRVDGEDTVDELSRLLEEQDANALGLNVVWLENYDELPEILNRIASPLTDGGADSSERS
jgi:SIR2-like domain